MNKKGVMADWQFLVIFMIVIALFLVFFIFSWGTVKSALMNNLVLGDTADSVEILNRGSEVVNALDLMFVFLFFGVGLALILVSLLTDTSSIFFWISLFVLGFMIFVCAILSNAFEAISQSGALADIAATMPLTTFIIDKYPLWIFMFIFLAGIVFYTKNQMR